MKNLVILTLAAATLSGCNFKAKSNGKVDNVKAKVGLSKVGNEFKCAVNGGGSVSIKREASGLEVTFYDASNQVKQVAIQNEANNMKVDLKFSGDECTSENLNAEGTKVKVVCGPMVVSGVQIPIVGDNQEAQRPVKQVSIKVEGIGELKAASDDPYVTAGELVVTSKYLSQDGSYDDKDTMLGRDVKPQILKSCVKVNK